MTRFQKYLSISVVIHAIIIVLLWFNPNFNFRDEKPYKVTWLKLSRGDGGTSKKASLKETKNLPQSTLREQKQALKELAKDKTGSDLKSKQSETKKTVQQKDSQKRTADNAGVNITKKTTPVTKKTDATINDALARIDQQLKQREVDLSSAQVKTNETGQSPWGSDEGSETDPALILYYNTIKRKINKEWILSKGDFTGALRTRIVVLIDGNGNVMSSTYKSTSGDGSFDESAMQALRRAAPFPIPPESIRQEAVSEGFLIEFNPNAVTGKI